MKRGFWWRKQGPSPLFPRQTRVRIHGAATGGIILFGNAPRFYLATHLDIHYLFFSRMAGPDLVPMAGKRTED